MRSLSRVRTGEGEGEGSFAVAPTPSSTAASRSIVLRIPADHLDIESSLIGRFHAYQPQSAQPHSEHTDRPQQENPTRNGVHRARNVTQVLGCRIFVPRMSETEHEKCGLTRIIVKRARSARTKANLLTKIRDPGERGGKAIEHRHRRWLGSVYQGRYKSFPMQDDGHFYTVMRCVERNPLRARPVDRARDWRWSSLGQRRAARSDAVPVIPLPPTIPLRTWPIPGPRDWVSWVNSPQTALAEDRVRRVITQSRPLGYARWTARTETQL